MEPLSQQKIGVNEFILGPLLNLDCVNANINVNVNAIPELSCEQLLLPLPLGGGLDLRLQPDDMMKDSCRVNVHDNINNNVNTKPEALRILPHHRTRRRLEWLCMM